MAQPKLKTQKLAEVAAALVTMTFAEVTALAEAFECEGHIIVDWAENYRAPTAGTEKALSPSGV